MESNHNIEMNNINNSFDHNRYNNDIIVTPWEVLGDLEDKTYIRLIEKFGTHSISQELIEKFKKLILLEILIGNTAVKDIVAAKISELKQMKLSNPLVQYEAFEKGGEVILDFLVSQNAADGKSVSIVERNVYRYKSLVEKTGKKGVLLFAVSERSYGNDIDRFLSNLKARRFDLVTLVGAFNVPAITVAK